MLHQGDDDFDVDGDPLTVDAFDSTSQFGGTVDVAADGAFTYSPAAGFAGVDTFAYTIGDGQGGSDAATVTITVEATANRSIDVELLEFALDDLGLSGQMLVTNSSDDGLTVQVVDLDVRVEYRQPGDRTWTVAELQAGSCQFDPSPDFVVTDEQLVGFTGCELVEPLPNDATVRTTGRVEIFMRTRGQGHADGWFESRTSG